MTFTNFTVTIDILEKLNQVKSIQLVPNTIILLVLLVTAIVGNGLILYVYAFKLKSKTDDRYFIPWLAILDIAACVVGSIFGIVVNFNPLNFRSDVTCKIIWTINKFTAVSSALLLLVISVQRYIKVCRPFNPTISTSQKRLSLLIVMIVSVVLAIPCLFFYGEADVIEKNNNYKIIGHGCGAVQDADTNLLFDYSVILLFTCIVGIIASSVLYCIILRAIYKQQSFKKKHSIRSMKSLHNNKRKEANGYAKNRFTFNTEEHLSVDKSDSSSGCAHLKSGDNPDIAQMQTKKLKKQRDTKASRKIVIFIRKVSRKHRFSVMFFLVSVLFILSYFPRAILMILESAVSDFWINLSDMEYVACLTGYRAYLFNNVVNPFIYFIFDTAFKKECKQLCCARRRPITQ